MSCFDVYILKGEGAVNWRSVGVSLTRQWVVVHQESHIIQVSLDCVVYKLFLFQDFFESELGALVFLHFLVIPQDIFSLPISQKQFQTGTSTQCQLILPLFH